MKRRPNSKSSSSPISKVQRDLAEQEARLKSDMERLKRQIEEAPVRKQEQLKRQQLELMQRFEQRGGSDFFSSVPDKRYEYRANVSTLPRGRRKGEQRAVFMQFLALLALLAIAIFLVIKALP